MSRRNLILIAAGGSLALLIGAYIFQMLGFAPCKLCLWQRWPHRAAVVIGALALWQRSAIFPWLGALAALTTSAIGVYHSGVERGLWEGPTTCTSTGVEGLTPDQLLDQILAAPLVRCDEIAWQMLGVTMPNLNAVFSLGLAVIWIAAARRSTA